MKLLPYTFFAGPRQVAGLGLRSSEVKQAPWISGDPGA